MLNELYALSKSLAHHGLSKSTTHPDIGKVGKSDCLLIELEESGAPCALRFIRKGSASALWKHSKGNHNSFPAIRVQRPILSESESKKIDHETWKNAKSSEKRQMLSQLDFSAMNPECVDVKISAWSIEQLKPVSLSALPELAALKRLISVFPREGQQPDFMQKLAQLLRQELLRCNEKEFLDCMKKLLVGEFGSNKGEYTAGCMTFYDMHETNLWENRVESSETRSALIQLLNSAQSASGQKHPPIISPLSGTKAAGIHSKYPSPNIPLLGQTYLYSKKTETPCLTRYTMSGAQAFRAGADEIQAINDALAFLTDASRKDKSWRAMGDSNRERPNLLLAYLPDNPENDALLAKILGDPPDYELGEEYREEAENVYTTLCEQVLGNLAHIRQKNPNATVHLILLEKLDEGRRQVAYESAFTAERLCENMLTWDAASQNTPPIEIRMRVKKKLKTITPICPGPYAICRLLKMNYTRSGHKAPLKQSDASLHEIYSLYTPALETDRTTLLELFFRLTVKKSRWLLADVAGQLILDSTLPQGMKWQTQAEDAAMFASLLSILLYFSAIRKEHYMLDVPFNVGQFLKLADFLHKEYCVQVRNGGNRQAQLPAQLMGNEMLAIATENPVEGLNRLRDRMRIYLAWAESATGESARRAKWTLARFAEVSARIAAAEGGVPEQFSPAQQAQVLLGYLAEIPNEKKKPGTTTQPNTEEVCSNA